MLNINSLINKPNKLKRFTSLTQSQFSFLVFCAKPLWEKAERQRLGRQSRKRAIGAGRPYKLFSIEAKLITTLLWYRTNAIHELLGWIMGVDGTNVGRLIQKMAPIIEQASDPLLATYLKEARVKRKKICSWDEFVREFPDIAEVMIDATEQKRRRPKGKRKQRKVFSGKKRTHTLKTQITVSKTGRILDVSLTYPGSVHDKKILDKEKTIDKLPKQTRKRLDKGYDGTQFDHSKAHIIIPYKVRRNKIPLTRGQKQANTLRSKARILVENTLARMKKYRVLDDKYRSNTANYNQHFRNIASLCNFRLAYSK